jgi:hypothetical protein
MPLLRYHHTKKMKSITIINFAFTIALLFLSLIYCQPQEWQSRIKQSQMMYATGESDGHLMVCGVL